MSNRVPFSFLYKFLVDIHSHVVNIQWMNKLSNIRQIYIGNILEAFFDSYAKLDIDERNYWAKYDASDNNRSLLYGTDNKILVTPIKINEHHVKTVSELTGWKNVNNIFPKQHSRSICNDLMEEGEFNELFISAIKANPGVELIPYRHTPEFYKLIEYLESKKLDIALPETINLKDQFIEQYYHSKRGYRHLWEMVHDENSPMTIPFGFITADKKEATDAAFWFKQKEKDFVIKYNRGVQGIGLWMCHQHEFSTQKDKFAAQIDELLKEEIWKEGCIVVEEFIHPDKNVLGGSPNVEMRVAADGIVHREYACEQVLDTDGKTFMGVSMNKEVNTSPLIELAYKAAERYANKLSQLGYRGYFDMDLVVSKEGKVYPMEANLRRTGGTHINDFCEELLGTNYSNEYYVISYEIKHGRDKNLNYDKVWESIKELTFDPKTKRGLVIVNPDLVHLGIIALLAIGHNKEEMNALVAKSKLLTRDL